MLKIIGGKYRGRILKVPKSSPHLRPSQGFFREALFNICQNNIENADLLDIFAGSGAIGFEALSRGAKHVTFIEQHRPTVKYIRENALILGVEDQVNIICGDAFKMIPALSRQKKSFDIIFADPPYHKMIQEELFSDNMSKLIDQNNSLLKNESLFFMECSNSQEKLTLNNLDFHRLRKFGQSLLHQFYSSKSP